MALFYHDGENIPTAPSKDPDSEVAYGGDYSTTEWATDSKIITASEWLINGVLIESEGDSVAGLTVNRPTDKPATPASNFTDTATSVWLHAGTLGDTYTLTNRLTLSDGAVLDYSMHIKIKQL